MYPNMSILKVKDWLIGGLVLFIVLAITMPAQVGASPANSKTMVEVQFPAFPVEFNGVSIESEQRMYPLLVYKGITYFPMTYYDSRFLGLETSWRAEEGLVINKTGISGAYRQQVADESSAPADKANDARKYATVADGKITLNGQYVQSLNTEYPFLVYKEVTYFPLIWQYAVEEFGWEYHWDTSNGLRIGSVNTLVTELELPSYSGESLTVAGNHYFYTGANGSIVQAPIDNPQEAANVYQLPIWSYGDGEQFVRAELENKNGEAWLNYRQGGAVMGHTVNVHLRQDGSYEKKEEINKQLFSFPEFFVSIGVGFPPAPGNLLITHASSNQKVTGNSDFLYGWEWAATEGGSGGGPNSPVYLYEDEIYMLAFHMEKDTDASRIHKVSTLTGETTRVSDKIAHSFTVANDILYFTHEGQLYSLSLSDGTETPLSTVGTADMEFYLQSLGENIYYVNSEDGELYAAGRNQSLNPKGKVTSLKTSGNHLIVTFAEIEKNSNPYRLIVINAEGEIVFKTSDPAVFGIVEDSRLIYGLEDSHSLYTAELIAPE